MKSEVLRSGFQFLVSLPQAAGLTEQAGQKQ